MSDKPPARVMPPGEVRDELASEWSRNPVRRGQVRLLSPRLAELLDALAMSKGELLRPMGAVDQSIPG